MIELRGTNDAFVQMIISVENVSKNIADRNTEFAVKQQSTLEIVIETSWT